MLLLFYFSYFYRSNYDDFYIFMTKRNTQQRRHTILSRVNEHGEVSVDDLALEFETSEVTIRKDLTALEKSGLLLRRYGGAMALPQEIVAKKQRQTRLSSQNGNCQSGSSTD